jgi:hypothetical protein
MLLAQDFVQWRVHVNRGNKILVFTETANFLTRRAAINLSKGLYSMELLSSVWMKRRHTNFRRLAWFLFLARSKFTCVANIVFSSLFTSLILMFMNCCCNYIIADKICCTWSLERLWTKLVRAQFGFWDWSVMWYGNSSPAKSSDITANPDWTLCYRECSARCAHMSVSNFDLILWILNFYLKFLKMF